MKKMGRYFFPFHVYSALLYILIGCWLALLKEAFRKNQQQPESLSIGCC
jgi:hypothetical protein